MGSWLLRRDVQVGRRLEELVDIGRWVRPPRRRLVRADDHLVLELALHGLGVVDGGAGPVMRRLAPRAHLVAHLPPQSVAEGAFKDRSQDDTPDPLPGTALPARARHSGPSRLAVTMPVDLHESPYTVGGVLDALAEWPIAVVPRGLYAPGRIAEVDRLHALADAVAATVPDDRAPAAARAARRAAAAVAADPSAVDVLAGNDVLAREVDVAARRPGLEDDARRAVELQAELRYAATLVGRARATVGPHAIVDVLPGLLFLYPPREPPPTATAMELRYRLVQWPAATAAFSPARLPVTRQGRTELWHTRLGRRDRGTGAQERVVRVARRAWGRSRAGSRVKDSFDNVVTRLARTRINRSRDGFLATPDQRGDTVRIPIDDGGQRPIGHVPAQERRRAIAMLVADAQAIEQDPLRLAAARLFGWRRTGAEIAATLGAHPPVGTAYHLPDEIGGEVREAMEALLRLATPVPAARWVAARCHVRQRWCCANRWRGRGRWARHPNVRTKQTRRPRRPWPCWPTSLHDILLWTQAVGDWDECREAGRRPCRR